MTNKLDRPSSRRFATIRSAIGVALVILLSLRPLWADPPSEPSGSPRPSVTIRIPSLQAAYAELKFAMELVGDPKGYLDLRDTFDLALEGIDVDHPCEIGIVATQDGLQTVGYLPARTNEDFRKFLQALDDADVRTASTIPSALRDRWKSVTLQPNERVIVSMYDGFLRFDDGYVRLGHHIEAVRRPHHVAPTVGQAATITVRLDGNAAPAGTRRAAFEKSKSGILEKLKKEEQQTEAAFAFQKSLADGLLAAIELAFAESSDLAINWKTLGDRKQFHLDATMTPEAGTALESDVRRIGRQVNPFAGVSREKTVFALSWNVPLNASLRAPMKSTAECARSVAREWILEATGLSEDQRSANRDFVDFACDVAADLSAAPDCSGVVRVWSGEKRSLTTVAAIGIPETRRFRDQIRAAKSWTGIASKPSDGGVVFYRLILSRWPHDFAELFDHEGAVTVAIDENAVWFGIGENALARMSEAIQQAGTQRGATSEAAISLSAAMQPLSDVWNQIHSRSAKPAKTKTTEQGRGKNRGKGDKRALDEKPSLALLKETAADLNLPQIASDAYRGGSDEIEISVTRDGDHVSLAARFEEGTLRFVGQTLSKFVRENF